MLKKTRRPWSPERRAAHELKFAVKKKRVRNPLERKRANAKWYANGGSAVIKATRAANKDAYSRVQKNTFYARTYGITLAQYEEMMSSRQNLCDICGERPPGGGPRGADGVLHVDHNHCTGKVRGLLCGPCNRRLGALEHRLYQKSLEYLRRTA